MQATPAAPPRRRHDAWSALFSDRPGSTSPSATVARRSNMRLNEVAAIPRGPPLCIPAHPSSATSPSFLARHPHLRQSASTSAASSATSSSAAARDDRRLCDEWPALPTRGSCSERRAQFVEAAAGGRKRAKNKRRNQQRRSKKAKSKLQAARAKGGSAAKEAMSAKAALGGCGGCGGIGGSGGGEAGYGGGLPGDDGEASDGAMLDAIRGDCASIQSLQRSRRLGGYADTIADTIQIFIKSLRGNTVTLDVRRSDTIDDVKRKIHDKEGIPADKQRLVFSGKPIGGHRTLLDCGVEKESTIHVLVSLLSDTALSRSCRLLELGPSPGNNSPSPSQSPSQSPGGTGMAGAVRSDPLHFDRTLRSSSPHAYSRHFDRLSLRGPLLEELEKFQPGDVTRAVNDATGFTLAHVAAKHGIGGYLVRLAEKVVQLTHQVDDVRWQVQLTQDTHTVGSSSSPRKRGNVQLKDGGDGSGNGDWTKVKARPATNQAAEEPAPAGPTWTSAGLGGGAAPTDTEHGGFPNDPGSWSCAACTSLNPHKAPSCSVCHTPSHQEDDCSLDRPPAIGEAIAAIFSQTDKNGRTAGHIAAIHGHPDCLEAIVDAIELSCSLEGNTCTCGELSCGDLLGRLHAINTAAGAGTAGTSACDACRKKEECHVIVLRVLQAKDNQGQTPALCAARTGNVECLELLSRKGVCDALRSTRTGRPLPEEPDVQTLAHAAALGGHLHCLRFLRSKGAILTANDSAGLTPAHVTAAEATLAMKEAVEHGATASGGTWGDEQWRAERAAKGEIDTKRASLVDERRLVEAREGCLRFLVETGNADSLLNTVVADPATLDRGGAYAVLLSDPALLDRGTKQAWLSTKLRNKAPGPPLPLVASRENPLHGLFGQLGIDTVTGMIRKDSEGAKHRRIDVYFVGEHASGDGLRREWLELVAKDIMDPARGLFVSTDKGRTLQPNPRSATTAGPDHLAYFTLLGRLVGFALLHRERVSVPLTRAFVKAVLGLPVVAEDLATVDPALYKGKIEYLRDSLYASNDGIAIEDLGLTFEDDGGFGEAVVYESKEERCNSGAVELRVGGAAVEVNESNKAEYLQLLAQHRLVGAIQPHIDAFRSGLGVALGPLGDVNACALQQWPERLQGTTAPPATMPPAVAADGGEGGDDAAAAAVAAAAAKEEAEGGARSLQSALVRCCSVADLEALVGAGATGDDIDVLDWQRNTDYRGGLEPGEPLATWFWDEVRAMSPDDRAALLAFSTGSGRAPAMGFGSLMGYGGKQHKFSLQLVEGADAGRLPTAATCFNTLRLPPYLTREDLRRKLRAAIAESSGFDEGAVQ